MWVLKMNRTLCELPMNDNQSTIKGPTHKNDYFMNILFLHFVINYTPYKYKSNANNNR